MLTRIHVDNYKALVNFDLALPKRSLLLGPNGSGKTSVIEALALVRQLMLGASVRILRTDTLTRWQASDSQIFEIEARVDTHHYRYTLEVEHHRDDGACRIKSERLLADGHQPLFSKDVGKAQLFRDDGTSGPEVLADWNRSSLPIISGKPYNKLLTRFVEWMSTEVIVCRINPMVMESLSEIDAPMMLETDLSNFSSWWRHVHDEDVDAAGELRDLLTESLPGFRGLEFRKVTERAKRLTARMGDHSYSFDELSEGQRGLIALYGMLVYARNRTVSLVLDEPDNFVSIREIQPFYNALEACDGVQAILISHHPTMTDLMAAECGIVFHRAVNAPVRLEQFRAPEGAMTTASELIARGYFDEPA